MHSDCSIFVPFVTVYFNHPTVPLRNGLFISDHFPGVVSHCVEEGFGLRGDLPE